jgi:hypothetical protein
LDHLKEEKKKKFIDAAAAEQTLPAHLTRIK